MTFSGHIAVTGLTLQMTSDPTTLITINLALHPTLDAIPHAEWSTFRSSKPKAIAISLFDFIVAGLYIWQLFVWLRQPTGLIVAALVAGIWLDILDPLAVRYWPPLHRFHVFTHSWPEPPDEPINWSKTVTGKTPLWVKLVVQSLLVLVPYWLLTRRSG